MQKIKVFVVLMIFATACNSAKNMDAYSNKSKSSSSIGLSMLHNYAVNPDVSLPDSINYKFIVDAEEFNKTFHMTKATPGTAVVPDFNNQSVVAVILKPTEKVVSIDINKAEVSDNDLNIYYTITDTTSWITYAHTIKAVATVRKNTNLKQVNFYNNDSKDKTLSVEY